MRILILGGTGMLGHKLAQVLAQDFDTFATLRGEADAWPKQLGRARPIGGIDVEDTDRVARLLDMLRPAALLNAVGAVKQTLGMDEAERAIMVNSLLPHRLARLCRERGIRFVHYGTDCVFSGARDSRRGPRGYREQDPADAGDLYGRSKLLGEPDQPGSLVLRLSLVGPELRGRHSLLEWFMAQKEGPVRGFAHALFTGITTLETAELTARILRRHPALDGLWHVAAEPISKLDFLRQVNDRFRRNADVVRDETFHCDRRLDGTRFRAATGWQAPAWAEMIDRMAADPAGEA